MKLEDIEKGMLVTINKDVHHTREAFGWSRHMNEYVGSAQIVKNIQKDGAINLTICNSQGFDFNWSAKDLSLRVVHPKKSKIVNFNIKNLDL